MSGELHHIVVMGVSGSGKTTVGEALAERLGWRFIEGDSFHPPENAAKMSAGIPLDDNDRAPWLKALAAEIARDEAAGRVVPGRLCVGIAILKFAAGSFLGFMLLPIVPCLASWSPPSGSLRPRASRRLPSAC